MTRRTFQGLTALFACLSIFYLLNSSTTGVEAAAAKRSAASAPAALAVDQIAVRMAEQLKQRDVHLRRYTVDRTYEVLTGSDKEAAIINARMEFTCPPASKQFRLLSKTNAGTVSNMVYEKATKGEQEALEGDILERSSITADNYYFTLVGQETIAGVPCYHLEVTPKRKEKFLFKGKVWVSANNYDLVRIEGSPIKSPSIWIKKLTFVRQFQNVGGMWLPSVDESVVDVRLYGQVKVKVRHHDYQLGR